MNGRDWAQIALITIALIFLMLLVVLSLGGCVIGTKADKLDEGKFWVDADCEKKRVKVELNLDRTDTDRSIEVRK